MKDFSLAAACLLTSGLIASPAMAIPITNHDFEATLGTVSAEGGANAGADPSDWTLVQPGAWDIFQFNPNDAGYAGTTDADAPNFGVTANMDGVTMVSLGKGGSVAQVTGTAFSSGTTYKLTVAIGFKAADIGDYILDITNGSGDSLATATGTPIHDTKLYNYSVSYTASGAVGETGNIGVKISASETGDGAIAIDNVRLTVVPEPSSFALAGLSLVGLISSTSRRKLSRRSRKG